MPASFRPLTATPQVRTLAIGPVMPALAVGVGETLRASRSRGAGGPAGAAGVYSDTGKSRGMRHTVRLFVGLFCIAACWSVAKASVPGAPIELSGFDGMASILEPVDGSEGDAPAPIMPVGIVDEPSRNRLYVSGIVGASFATLTSGGDNRLSDSQFGQTGSINETIFTGGGALGMAIARPAGLLRMEVEGRARGPMIGQSRLTIDGDAITPLDARATNGWSALTNFWRDYSVTDTLGIYAGGGFGVGGYQYSLATPANTAFVQLSGSSVVNTFAWQLGTGVVYEISDRVTLDTGYRFFAMAPGATTLSATNGIGLGTYTSAFSASELLVSIRIYEPFRNWR